MKLACLSATLLALATASPSAERTLDHPDPLGRTLVVYPVVEWQWTYEFQDLTPAALPVRQTTAGFTLEITALDQRVVEGERWRCTLDYQVGRARAVSQLRLVADIEVPDRTIEWVSSRQRSQNNAPVSGTWTVEWDGLPRPLTLTVRAHEGLTPAGLAELVRAHGPLTPGEIGYDTAKHIAGDALERLTGQRLALSDSFGPTGVFGPSPAYQFALDDGLPLRTAAVHRLTGRLLLVSGHRARMSPSEEAGRRRAYEVLRRVWPPPAGAAYRDEDPADLVVSWDPANPQRVSRAQYWYLPSPADAALCDHFTVTLGPDGNFESATCLPSVPLPVPTIAVADAVRRAEAFLAAHGYAPTQYAITETGRQYRPPFTNWPAGQPHRPVEALPQWRFVRVLECVPTDARLEPHYLFVDAHTGEVIDWYRLPPGTPLPLRAP